MKDSSRTTPDTPFRRAFRHYLRTGQRLSPALFDTEDGAPIERKYNHWHDNVGRFTYTGNGTHDGNYVAGNALVRTPAGHRSGKQGAAAHSFSGGTSARPHHNDNVVPGPLPTYRDRNDIHEQMARNANRLATTPGATGKLKLGGYEFSAQRLGTDQIKLEAKPFIFTSVKISGRIRIKSGINAIKINSILIQLSHGTINSSPTEIILFRDKTGNLNYHLDRRLKLNISGFIINISDGHHPIDQK